MTLTGTSQNQLRQYVEQIERLEEEKKGIQEDIKDKYTEAAATGFDKKILKMVVKLRKKSSTERQEEESVLDTYLHALNMIPDEVETE